MQTKGRETKLGWCNALLPGGLNPGVRCNTTLLSCHTPVDALGITFLYDFLVNWEMKPAAAKCFMCRVVKPLGANHFRPSPKVPARVKGHGEAKEDWGPLPKVQGFIINPVLRPQGSLIIMVMEELTCGHFTTEMHPCCCCQRVIRVKFTSLV
jgi:hypothetical protein